jgi:predicted amino acid-binding ACT domain protein
MLDKNYQTIGRFSKNDRNRNISVEDTFARTHAEEGESSIDHLRKGSVALFQLFHEIDTKGLVSKFSAEIFRKQQLIELNNIKQQLLQANIALTGLITSSKEKENYYLSLEQFEKAALTDVGKKLLFLLSSHYSNECKTFSQEIFPYQMTNVLTKLSKSCKKKKTMEMMTLFSFNDCKAASDKPSLLVLLENPLIGNYCFFLDISSHLKAEMNQLAVSIQILWEMIGWMIFVNIYSGNSIEISREYSKLASLYFNIGQFVIAYNLALKAYSLLEKYCSSSDHDKEEMEQIILYYERMICKVNR